MELWVAGVILLVLLAGVLVLILCGKKIHKGLRIAGVCVLGALFAAVLGYIVLTFLFLDALDSPSLDEPTVSGTVLSEEQATLSVLNLAYFRRHRRRKYKTTISICLEVLKNPKINQVLFYQAE